MENVSTIDCAGKTWALDGVGQFPISTNRQIFVSLPIEHLDLLNVSTLGIDALKCLTHYFLVSTDHLVHRHDLLTVHEKGDVPVAWFKQRFNRCYTFRQTAPRILYDSSPAGHARIIETDVPRSSIFVNSSSI